MAGQAGLLGPRDRQGDRRQRPAGPTGGLAITDRRRASRSTVALLLVLAALSKAVAAAPALESVTVTAKVERGAAPTVSMSYVLRPAGATSVAFSSIHFDGVRATNIRAFLGSREVSFRTGEGSGLRLDGTVELPAMKAEGRLQLRLEYEVQPAWSADGPDLVLPLLVAHWPPDEARSGTFRADVVLPAGSFIYSAFPTGFVRTEAIDLGSDGPSYRFVLPVVPALLRLRVGDGPPPLVTFESAVDAATIAVLVFFAVVGWRRIREHWT